ncbi:MAG TPA: hypothetical protein H9840_05870 [Candidatus Anaerofilum excrementigallinarum]|nr:hypothetical protein [Candidatus Anaerofilum excrementigallinarum]
MAKLEKTLHGRFQDILNALEDAVMRGSVTASWEAASDFRQGDCRCAVRVYERYSAFGGNRVSLTITLFGNDGCCHLSAIAAGGSQGLFFKVNTLSENSFLDTIADTVNRLE